MRVHICSASLLALVLASAPSRAIAQSPVSTRVGITPLEAEGDLSEGQPEQLAAAIKEGVRRGNTEVFELNAEGECASDACEDRFDPGRDVVLSARISASGRNYEIAIELRRAGEDAPLALVEADCEICGAAEVEQAVADLTAQLVPKLENIEPAAATIVVSGIPKRASLAIDGEVLGQTPFEGSLAPGTHEVEISKEGYATQRREWTAAPGVRETLSYELNPQHIRDTAPMRPLWGWLGLGGGVALAGSGATLWALHGRPHRPTCTGAEVDANGRCPNMWETRGLGIGLVAGGVAALGVGIGLLIHSYRAGKRESRTARIEGMASALGLGGRF